VRKIITILLILILVFSLNPVVNSIKLKTNNEIDYDPLTDVEVTVEIQTIRYLEEFVPETVNRNIFNRYAPRTIFMNAIQKFLNLKKETSSEPSMFVKVLINDAEFNSNKWSNSRYVYNPSWSATLDVPDDTEFVNIKIQLWLSQSNKNIPCDLSGNSNTKEAELTYSIKTGHWQGDDQLSDPSGYGRLCGCDDGTIYDNDQDCELWFDIYQNDFDNDNIPYWAEINDYQTDPELKNIGDPDNDKIPVEWEYKWGYNPFIFDDHENIDFDEDSINNYEEYLTSELFFSDPFRKDVFVEYDIMEEGPNGEKSYFPIGAKELIYNAFNRQNIVYHLDMDSPEGHDIVPFYNTIQGRDIIDVYVNYFLHGDENNWRRGVFHHGLVVYNVDGPPGFLYRRNAFLIASKGMEEKAANPFLGNREIVYGSAYMHELGHSFAFWPIPGHDDDSKNPLQPGYWENRPYRSCMNYGWIYQIVDYSNGTGAEPDIDDWARINYHYFESDWHITDDIISSKV